MEDAAKVITLVEHALVLGVSVVVLTRRTRGQEVREVSEEVNCHTAEYPGEEA